MPLLRIEKIARAAAFAAAFGDNVDRSGEGSVSVESSRRAFNDFYAFNGIGGNFKGIKISTWLEREPRSDTEPIEEAVPLLLM